MPHASKESRKAYNRKYMRGYYKRNPKKFKEASLKRNYGINLDKYNQMLLEQEGKCAICRHPRELYVDHCHDNGTIRGLLCNKCNLGIGLLSHDVNVLDSASAYLRKAS